MIFIALGSSIGNAELIFNETAIFLENFGIRVLKKSKILKNPPMGGVAKNEFSNAVWEIDFWGTPLELLESLKHAETHFERDFSAPKWADRSIDLDILAFHDLQMTTEKLTIPHAEIPKRIFVLKPWAEITDRNFEIPKFGNLRDLYATLRLKNL